MIGMDINGLLGAKNYLPIFLVPNEGLNFNSDTLADGIYRMHWNGPAQQSIGLPNPYAGLVISLHALSTFPLQIYIPYSEVIKPKIRQLSSENSQGSWREFTLT